LLAINFDPLGHGDTFNQLNNKRTSEGFTVRVAVNQRKPPAEPVKGLNAGNDAAVFRLSFEIYTA
jgi:hypothetical protein